MREKLRTCQVCGRNSKITRVHDSKKFGRVLCQKHYLQCQRHGSTVKRTCHDPNEIVLSHGYAEVLLYDIHGDEIARSKIDLEDVNGVSRYKWHYDRGRVSTNTEEGGRLSLHRLLHGTPKRLHTKHINGNLLDNRKANLYNACAEPELSALEFRTLMRREVGDVESNES